MDEEPEIKVKIREDSRYPIKQGGRWNVPNFFKMDFYSILLLVLVIVLVIAYKADTAKCDSVIADPCGFCNTTGCCLGGVVGDGVGGDPYYGVDLAVDS